MIRTKVVKSLASLAIVLLAIVPVAMAADRPVAEAKPEFQKQRDHSTQWLDNECLAKRKNDIWCRRNAAYHATDFFFLGDYKKSLHYISVFDKLWAENYYYISYDPCPYIDFKTKITKPETNYIFGSAQARFVIDLARNSPGARESGLRAFLCSLVSHGYDMQMNLTDYRFTRDNFKEFVTKYYPNDQRMDPDLFLSEIQEPAQVAYSNVVGNHWWGKNWKEDTRLHVKLSELYKNAANHCKTMNLSQNYCIFLDQMAVLEKSVSANLTENGEIE